MTLAQEFTKEVGDEEHSRQMEKRNKGMEWGLDKPEGWEEEA